MVCDQRLASFSCSGPVRPVLEKVIDSQHEIGVGFICLELPPVLLGSLGIDGARKNWGCWVDREAYPKGANFTLHPHIFLISG
jgi:hypothetical protein